MRTQRNQGWLFIALSLVLACGNSCSSQSVTVLSATSMTATGPAGKAAGGAVTFWGNGTLQALVSVKKGPVTISVEGRGNSVDGGAPVLQVMLAGRELGKLSFDDPEFKELTVTGSPEVNGVTQLVLSFGNYIAKDSQLLSRWLEIRTLTMRQQY